MKQENKPLKIILNEKQYETMQSFKKELKKRGLSKVDLSLLFQRALENQEESFLKEVLEEMTPLEYKIKELSQNKNHQEKIKDFISTLKEEG